MKKKKIGPVPFWEQVWSPRRCDCSAFKATQATEIILAEESVGESEDGASTEMLFST